LRNAQEKEFFSPLEEGERRIHLRRLDDVLAALEDLNLREQELSASLREKLVNEGIPLLSGATVTELIDLVLSRQEDFMLKERRTGPRRRRLSYVPNDDDLVRVISTATTASQASLTTLTVFSRVLIANRGEIASRLIRACHDLGLEAVAVYSDADADSPFVGQADRALRIGPGPAVESYLNNAAILDAARQTRAEALHPGYGFLAENAGFARACEDAGIRWVGPPPAAMEAMADKVEARRLAAEADVPIVPGSDGPVDIERAPALAKEIGYPLMAKAAKGGGGIGMTLVRDEKELEAALGTAMTRAAAAFGDAAVFLEKYVENPRHVEVQVMARPTALSSTCTSGSARCSADIKR